MLRRAMQDYSAWPSHGTAPFWSQFTENPHVSSEILAQHLNMLGCVSPNEPTSAGAAAAILVAQLGMAATTVSQEAAWNCFSQFKASHASMDAHVIAQRLHHSR